MHLLSLFLTLAQLEPVENVFLSKHILVKQCYFRQNYGLPVALERSPLWVSFFRQNSKNLLTKYVHVTELENVSRKYLGIALSY